jgi:hypothetical protein
LDYRNSRSAEQDAREQIAPPMDSPNVEHEVAEVDVFPPALASFLLHQRCVTIVNGPLQ